MLIYCVNKLLLLSPDGNIIMFVLQFIKKKILAVRLQYVLNLLVGKSRFH